MQKRKGHAALNLPTRSGNVNFYITRDSVEGAVTTNCDLWFLKPIRSVQGERVCWVPATLKAGHVGFFSPADLKKRFGVCADTDRELVIVEQWTTAA